MRDYLRRIIEVNRGMSTVSKYIYATIGALLIALLIKNAASHQEIILYIIPFYTAVVFHEVAHGFAANLMGDPTAKIFKRLSLNPLKHIDIMGTLVPIFLILTGMPFVVGWAKPVPVNYSRIKNKPVGIIVVALAGVLANIINIILATVALRVFYTKFEYMPIINSFFSGKVSWSLDSVMILSLFFIIAVNLALAIFNLIPIPPLDGSKVLKEVLPYGGKKFMDDTERYGMFIIMGLLYFGVIQKIMIPIFSFFLDKIL